MKHIAEVEGACVFPPDPHGHFNITTADGHPVSEATTSVRHRMIMPRYATGSERAQTTRKPGTYLYCGVYFGHFGHFVLETLSRLWAYAQVSDEIDGLVFFLKNRNPPDPKTHAAYFKAAGITHPIHFIKEPVTVDRLFVPQQGMGMGPYATGLPEQRACLDRIFRTLSTPVEPVENVYISRTGYKMQRGAFLAETKFEATLKDIGYKIFHPQSEPIGVQVGTYLAAKRIVSADSSALHVVGFVADPSQDIAIILRRHHGAVDLFPQIAAKTRREPLLINAIRQIHAPEVHKKGQWGSYAELNWHKVYTVLIQNGFVPESIRIPRRMKLFMSENLADVAARFGPLKTVDPNSEAPDIETSYFRL